MGLPVDHTALLNRGDYPLPPGADLDDAQRELLAKYGHWLESLATGVIEPVTAEQHRFVRAARGEAEPHSAFEVAWCRLRRADPPPAPEVGPLELAARLDEVRRAREAVAAARDESAARRAAILAPVQPLLDALDAEDADRQRALAAEVARLESAARDAVLAYGGSFRHAGIHAVYARGRVTWDDKGLAAYAESHPGVTEFRRVGRPSVGLRYDPPPG